MFHFQFTLQFMIYSKSNKYFFSTYYMPGTVVNPGDTRIRQTCSVFTECRIQWIFVGSFFNFLCSSYYSTCSWYLRTISGFFLSRYWVFYLELLLLNFLQIQMKTSELIYLYNSSKNTGNELILKLISISKNHLKYT